MEQALHGGEVGEDGEEDDWIVDCARAYVSLEFRFLVGSLTNSGMAQQLRRPAQRRN